MDEKPVRLAQLLVGLSLVADVGMGLEPGEAARAAVLAARLAAQPRTPGRDARPPPGGRRRGGEVAPDRRGLQPRQLRGRRAHERAAGARRRGGGGLLAVYEQVDGRGGPRRLRGDAIPMAARIAQVAVYASLFDRLGGADLAVATLRRRAGRALDADLVEAFCARAGTLLDGLARADVPHAALDAAAPGVEIEASQLDDVCRAFGGVVDLKSPYLHEHAARVSDLAARAAAWLRMPPDDVAAIRRAGFLHDLGRAAVPNGIWEKQGRLTSAEWERVRLHAYHSERILTACPPLEPLARLAGMHHERLDGSGYHREATAAAIPMPARILAAADAFQAMTQPRPHRSARDPEAVAAVLVQDAEAGRLDPDAVAAVRAAAGEPIRRRRSGPSGLTDRQIEVLRLLAAGLSNREIGRRLSVSPRTAEHHVQDIYARIGVSTRASAALYAMQNDLLS